MQCKYYQMLLGWTCEWPLWRGGRFIEVVFKTGLTVDDFWTPNHFLIFIKFCLSGFSESTSDDRQ